MIGSGIPINQRRAPFAMVLSPYFDAGERRRDGFGSHTSNRSMLQTYFLGTPRSA
jgi:hypothetical protein